MKKWFKHKWGWHWFQAWPDHSYPSACLSYKQWASRTWRLSCCLVLFSWGELQSGLVTAGLLSGGRRKDYGCNVPKSETLLALLILPQVLSVLWEGSNISRTSIWWAGNWNATRALGLNPTPIALSSRVPISSPWLQLSFPKRQPHHKITFKKLIRSKWHAQGWTAHQ